MVRKIAYMIFFFFLMQMTCVSASDFNEDE